MLQVPVATRVAVEPETVQTEEVSDVKLTVSPDDAVALRLTVPAESGVDGGGVKEMV
jgi:hypothetical protein